MTINVTTPEGRNREVRNIALREAKKQLERARYEIDFLILATPTGDRRNSLTEVNIHMLSAENVLRTIQREDS